MTSRRAAVAAWESLFRSQVSVMRHLTLGFPTHGISFNEYDVMLNLSQQEGRRIRMKNLNQHLLLTQPSISRLIDRLVSRGIVEKEVDPGDARGIIVRLTDEGFALFRRVAATHVDRIYDRVGSVLDDEELAQLTVLTDKLRTGAPKTTTSEPSTPTDEETNG